MKRRKRRAPTGAFCRYHQPDDKGGPPHNIKRINEPLSPALSPLVPRGERESLRARFGGTDEMRPARPRGRRLGFCVSGRVLYPSPLTVPKLTDDGTKEYFA